MKCRVNSFSLLFLILLGLAACVSSQINKRLTYEDQLVFDLLERIRKNASDKEALRELPLAYDAALSKRQQITDDQYMQLPAGDRWMELAKQWLVVQKMYQDISAVPAARRAVPQLYDPATSIREAREQAAEEYYNQGLTFLNYQNRAYAQKAFDQFAKANQAVPGYRDVTQLMARAQELATIKVVVRPVDYNNYGFGYWGFQNDWLQWEMVRDLNGMSFRDVRFFTDRDASIQRIQADRVVEMHLRPIFIGQVRSRQYTIQRSKQIQTGETKSIPPKPVYTTVYATIYVTERVLESYATLECRIYDWPTGRNILFDQFPGRDRWDASSARYTGDRRALTASDLTLINNPGGNPPSREQIAERIIRESYGLLLNRIRSGVSFQ